MQWIKKVQISWHLFADIDRLIYIRTMQSLYGDICWCLFYPVASFEHVQNLPTDKLYISSPSVLIGICTFLICFVCNWYVICPVFDPSISGDVR